MKSFKEIKALLENRYMVKFEKGGSMKLREYEASSEMAAHSKANVDAKRMGMSVASVRLKEVEKKTKDSAAMDEAHQEVSADFKVTASGRKVPAQRKVVKDSEDQQQNEAVLEEAVTVKKQDYSWGKMVTVHHGSENSYPLHPEHQKKIASLKDGEHTSFTDETNRKVSAHREGDKVHLSGAGSNKKTTVDHKHFTESVDLEEATDKQELRFLQLARIGLVDKSDVSKLRMAMDQLKADKQVSMTQRALIFSVFQDLVDLVTGDDTIFQRVRMDIQKESVEDLDENTEALKKKSEKSGVSLGTLKTVYKRGVAAWNSGHRPGTTPQQWGMARVNSYITKGKGTYHGADKDLREGGEPGEFNVNDIEEACWDTHKQVGMKKKGDKMVPNCVPKESVELEEDSRLDNKAYHKGVSDKTAQARVSHWKKMDKLSDRDPKAYEPAPGDATAKTITSKHTKKYHAMYGENYVSDAQRKAVWASRNEKGIKEDDDVPFDKPYTKIKPDVITDKGGAKHTTFSRVRDLARKALQKQQAKQANLEKK